MNWYRCPFCEMDIEDSIASLNAHRETGGPCDIRMDALRKEQED